MSSSSNIASACEEIRKKYSPCDVCDALLTLHVPFAGFLKDFMPMTAKSGSTARIVAPISTIVFVWLDHQPGADAHGISVPQASNLPKDKHWTEVAPEGSVVLMQQPPDQIVGLLGDIVATRYKTRGIRGVFIDGRARDVVGCSALSDGGAYQCWSKTITSVGTSLQAKPWAVDVPLNVGGVEVKPGDILVADEGEKAVTVIPQDRLDEIMELMPVLKEADDGLLKDVQNGMDFKSAIKRHPKHYSNH